MKMFIVIGGIILVVSILLNLPVKTPLLTNQNKPKITKNDLLQETIMARDLDTPWAIAFLPDKSLLITERSGQVRLISADGQLDPKPVAILEKVSEIGEGGLLGIALHPDFENNQYIYLYYTYDNIDDDTLNRVVRMKYENNELTDEKIIVERIPGASNHNGGRIKFGPDGFLYIATGDAQNPSQAQDVNSLAGKILRVTDEGSPAPGNPFENAVFSYGHRNVQGIVWDSANKLWATEHGRSGVLSGLDEINLIEAGKNYGWPEIQGNEQKSGSETPKRNSGSDTWAPAGAAFVGQSLFFGGLRGEALYEAVIQNNQVSSLKEHFKNKYGRIREVIAGADGMLYLTTSNEDGRGQPRENDDKIIRINSSKLQ